MDSTGPKKTGNGKTAITAHQPARPLSGEALSAFLMSLAAHAEIALTAAQACKQAKRTGYLVDSAEVERALEVLVAAGQLFRHPHAAGRGSSAHGYWRASADAFVEQRLQQLLGANTQITMAKLRTAIPKNYHTVLDAAVAALLRSGKLFEKPGTKARSFTTRRLPATSVLTAAQHKSLAGMLSKLNALRSQPLTLVEVLQFLDGESLPPNSASPAPTLALLDELYRLDLPARGGLSSMPIPFTWRRYAQRSSKADRAAFEQLLLDSAAAGRIELIAHEWPATLSAEDLAAAIRQPGGRVLYYWRPLEQS